MRFRRFYYHFKPFLPWRLRLALRRAWYRRKRTLCADIWPIHPKAHRWPKGWPGWPEGKTFAFVLTHDIETDLGVSLTAPLIEVEKRMGFRSSFNLIPEGGYAVPDQLRRQMTAAGFEIGVHDLRHDGKLYRDRERFRQNAARINQYLKEWNAVGFRSGFMLHNLDWLHDLDIQYDASTFDTDPFEPQPDGVHTIFPFLVRKTEDRGPKTEDGAQRTEDRDQRSEVSHPLSEQSSGCASTDPQARTSGAEGYIELPYTLPQDFSLFILMREKTPAIWKRKLDWIVENGGMALVDVHPDYMSFNGKGSRQWSYPASHYEDLLDYVRTRYQGCYWHPLPRDMAAFVKQWSTKNL